MARDKAKDDKLFNCSQDWEHDEVASHYGNNKQKVLDFLQVSCDNDIIKNSTHKEVYDLIKSKFGYNIPV